jgi:hypothetical protein
MREDQKQRINGPNGTDRTDGTDGLAAAESGIAMGRERRATNRVPVLKSARLIVGADPNSYVYDCLVLDETPNGLMIDLGALVDLPAEFTIRLQGGTYLVRKCWSAGTKTGLHFEGNQIITKEAASRMIKIAEIMHDQGVAAACATLRGARYFDQDELRRAAEAAEAACLRLEAMLTGRQAV